MAQFKTGRMTDTTLLKDVDDHYQDLEDSVVYAFGLPTNQDMTGQIFQNTTLDGILGGIFRSAAPFVASPGSGPGWRFRDTTNNDEFLVVSSDGHLCLYENTGSQATPTWTMRNRIDLSDGTWDVISTGGIGAGCSVYKPYGSQDFSAGAFMDFEWEEYDDASYWSTAARDRFIIPVDGRYRVHWQANYILTSPAYNVSIFSSLWLNGTQEDQSVTGSGSKAVVDGDADPVEAGVGVHQSFVVEASASDYLQFYFFTQNTLAGVITDGSATIERIA